MSETRTFAEELRAQADQARDWLQQGLDRHDPELQEIAQGRLAELEELAERNGDALAAS